MLPISNNNINPIVPMSKKLYNRLPYKTTVYPFRHVFQEALLKDLQFDATTRYSATDQDKQDIFNGQLGQVLERNIGHNPFPIYDGKLKGRFDPKAKLIDTTGDWFKKASAGEQLFTNLYNDLIQNNGAIPDPNILERSLGNSMFGDFLKAGAGLTNIDYNLLAKDFAFTDNGVSYRGKQSKLAPDELSLLVKYSNRLSGRDLRGRQNFIEKMGDIAATFAWDMIPLVISGGITEGIIGLTSVAEAATKAGYLAQKALEAGRLASTLQLAGLPRTVDAFKVGLDAGANEVFNNVKLGMLGTATGELGRMVFKGADAIGATRELLKARPAFREEMSKVGGSFGFGYISGKLAGENDDDALALALVMAGTHMTNAKAFRNILTEHRERNVVVRTSVPDAKYDPLVDGENYFLQKDNKLHILDPELFKNEGRIVPVEGVDPITLDASNSNQYRPYHEVLSPTYKKFGDALKDVRLDRRANEMYKRMIKGKDKDYIRENGLAIRAMSRLFVQSMVTEDWAKIRGSWSLPKDPELMNTLVKISNDFQIPFTTAKRLVLTGVLGQPDINGISKSFGSQAQDLEQFLRGGVLKAVKQTESAFDREVQGEVYKTKFDNLYGFIKDNLEDTSIRRKTKSRQAKAVKDFGILKEKLSAEVDKNIKAGGEGKTTTTPEELAAVMDEKALTILKQMREDVSDDSPKAFVIDKQIERLKADRRSNATFTKLRDIENIKKGFNETVGKLFDLNPELKVEHLFTNIKGEPDFSKSKNPEESKKLYEQFKGLREESRKLNDEVIKDMDKEKAFKDVNEREMFRNTLQIIEDNLSSFDLTRDKEFSKKYGDRFAVNEADFENIKTEVEKFIKSDEANSERGVEKLASLLKIPDHLMPLIKAVADEGLVKHIKLESSRSIYGSYDFDTRTLTLNKNAYLEKPSPSIPDTFLTKTGLAGAQTTFIHEVLHSIFDKLPATNQISFSEKMLQMGQEAIDRMDSMINQMEDVKPLENVRKSLINDRNFMARNFALTPESHGKVFHFELATWTLTNPGLLKLLDSMPGTENAYVKSDNKGVSNGFAKAIADWVRKLFKLAFKDKPSLADDIVKTVDDYISKSMGHGFNKDLGIEKGKTVKSEPKLTQISNTKGGTRQEQNLRHGLYRVEDKIGLERKYGSETAKKYEKLIEEDNIDKRDSGEREVGTPEQEASFTDVLTSMQSKDVQDLSNPKTAGLENNRVFDVIKGAKVLDITSAGLLGKKYLDLNMPPIFYANMSKRFKDNAYEPGEKLIREMPRVFNTIFNSRQGWAGGVPFLDFVKDIKNPTPEAQHFLNSFRVYSHGRSTGMIEKDMTWNEFADWAKFNTRQRNMLDRYRKGTGDYIRAMKSKRTDYFTDFVDNLSSFATKKQLKELGLDPEDKAINENLNKDKKLKRALAKKIVDKIYSGWGRNVYYNETRPTDPNTWIVEVNRPRAGAVADETGKVPQDQIYTYFDNEKEAKTFLNDKLNEGYKKKEFYQLKQIIKNKAQWSKLSANQLMELASEGHIDMTDALVKDTINKLKEATVKGVNVHTLRKSYIEGMKYTPAEFAKQFERFGRESVNGTYKSYYLTQIDKNLTKWRADLNTVIKSGKLQSKVKQATAELEYAQRYLNQLKQPERTIVDDLRGMTILYQVGLLKPAFLLQQALQIFQTTFNSAVAEGKTAGHGIRAFNESIVPAFKAMLALKRNYNENAARYPDGALSPKTINRLKTLENMNKIGGIGISELTADATEFEYTYETNPIKKHLRGAQNIANAAGKAVEKWTRVVTALTYEKLGEAKGLKGQDLINFMADGIDKNMSEWGKGGRAPLLDSKLVTPNNHPLVNALKKSALTYKTFSFYNYGLWRDMIRGKQGAALFSKLTTGVLLGGVKTLPLMASVMMLADLFNDDTTDYKLWQLADAIDEKLPGVGKVLNTGLGSLLGWDLSRTLGEDTPLATDLYANSWADTWHGKLVEIGLGAPFGFAQTQIAGSAQLKNEIWDMITNNTYHTQEEEKRARKIFERMLPISIKNIFGAMDMKHDGIEVRGKVMTIREDLSLMDVVSKALSFNLSKISRDYAEYSGGVEAQYNRAKQILRRGATHRRDLMKALTKRNVSDEAKARIIKEEMVQVVKDMVEARAKIKQLQPQIDLINLKRKISERRKELEQQ